jgi:hypothetical protein
MKLLGTRFGGTLAALILLAPLFGQAADLQPVFPTGPVGEAANGAAHYRYPLSRFIPIAGPLVLRDQNTMTKISIPVSGRLKPKSMSVTLNYTNSIGLSASTSVLAVRFNETTLAQIRLDPNNPNGSAKVNLPVELIRSGYNVLVLAATQHNGDPCEDPEAPELWTEINTATSALEIDGDYTTAPLHLSDFDQIFSPGIGAARRLSLVTPPLGTDSALISSTALVAEAVALRAQYESVDLHPAALASPAAWTSDDHVIVGTRDQIASALGDEADKIQGPYLSLRTLDHRQVQMVVSGKSPQDVATAAKALSYFNLPFADATSASVKSVDDKAGTAGRALQPGHLYSFEELGTPTTTLAGVGSQRVTLELPLPPDLYAPESASVDLLLDLNYAAGMGPGSVLNVDVNGKFLHGIALSNENGSAFRDYRISVPLRDLIGGKNQIGFLFTMHPGRKDKCVGVSGRHLATTLSGASSVSIPDAAHVAAQPDLDLMVRTGFPFSAATAPTTVWVSDASLLGAGWTLAGRLAQVTGGPLPQLQFAIGGEPPHGPALLIGEAKSLPPRLFQGAMQAFGDVHRMPYSSFDSQQGAEAPGLFDRIWPFGDKPRKPGSPLPAGSVEQSNDLGDNVILTAVRADDGHGTTTIVTAGNRDRLAAGVQELVSPQYWGQARGDFMLWKGKPDQVVTLRLSPRYQIGAAPAMMGLRFYVSQHPWWWLGCSVIVLVGLTGLTVWLLSRRRPKGD